MNRRARGQAATTGNVARGPRKTGNHRGQIFRVVRVFSWLEKLCDTQRYTHTIGVED